MKRSDAIKKLIYKVISPYEIISQEMFDSGVYYERAERLLEFIEKELGMTPPLDSSYVAYYAKDAGYENYADAMTNGLFLEADGGWEPEDET